MTVVMVRGEPHSCLVIPPSTWGRLHKPQHSGYFGSHGGIQFIPTKLKLAATQGKYRTCFVCFLFVFLRWSSQMLFLDWDFVRKQNKHFWSSLKNLYKHLLLGCIFFFFFTVERITFISGTKSLTGTGWLLQTVAYYTRTAHTSEHSLDVHQVISPHLLPLTQGGACAESWRGLWSAWWCRNSKSLIPAHLSSLSVCLQFHNCWFPWSPYERAPDATHQSQPGSSSESPRPASPTLLYGHAPPVPPPGLQIYC